MIETNPEAYSIAAQHIKAGGWVVDAHRGHILGRSGKPLTRRSPDGYLHPKFRHPENWHVEVSVFAHRVIWEHVHGPIAPGLTINHKNGDKTDNRIENLELVTVGDNVRHAIATGLRRPRRGQAAANSRLTESQVRTIRQRCTHERVSDLAREFNVSYWTISSIKHNRTWTHVVSDVA
ncbi:HNH endonuclease signature motif containing protein [Gordonia sp. SND2]|uniref:HNH endonuclease signature motif containing protein n=1 Tax=Gordonia sp. SND2 TaxID=3388659 RepID=UPI00398ADCEE